MYADIYRKASRPAKAQSARRFVSSRQVRLGHAPSAMGGPYEISDLRSAIMKIVTTGNRGEDIDPTAVGVRQSN
jgi:hypothetical protein